MIHDRFCCNRGSSFVKRISYLANKDETRSFPVLRSTRIVGGAGFTLHEIRFTRNVLSGDVATNHHK